MTRTHSGNIMLTRATVALVGSLAVSASILEHLGLPLTFVSAGNVDAGTRVQRRHVRVLPARAVRTVPYLVQQYRDRLGGRFKKDLSNQREAWSGTLDAKYRAEKRHAQTVRLRESGRTVHLAAVHFLCLVLLLLLLSELFHYRSWVLCMIGLPFVNNLGEGVEIDCRFGVIVIRMWVFDLRGRDKVMEWDA
ncbi:hypothetical protein EDB89DRAFT_1906104 [Lactarius sanguifluus]|nr:hypothetical protein EDB89DRAFT_1906104 [Lactarius sanguifluus]